MITDVITMDSELSSWSPHQMSWSCFAAGLRWFSVCALRKKGLPVWQTWRAGRIIARS